MMILSFSVRCSCSALEAKLQAKHREREEKIKRKKHGLFHFKRWLLAIDYVSVCFNNDCIMYLAGGMSGPVFSVYSLFIEA